MDGTGRTVTELLDTVVHRAGTTKTYYPDNHGPRSINNKGYPIKKKALGGGGGGGGVDFFSFFIFCVYYYFFVCLFFFYSKLFDLI